MFISYRWLQRHVDLTGLSPEDVASDLTLSTAEVEGLEPFLPHLADVTVGHVRAREKHPDADKLSVCTVDVGNAEPLQIVCGAPNVDAGQNVAVATVGTVLPGELKIKASKIRGVASQGMICSVRELGLGEEHDGIWVLPEGLSVGAPVAGELDMQDWVIEIDNKSITHRPDLWGHRGIANELAAMHRRELKPLDLSPPAAGDGASVPVRVESGACPRYLAVSLDGLRNGPSPAWMRRLLLAVGQRPIDLLVDVSNFVMLDLGQPNHLFDRDRLGPEGIVVRHARDGERMTTLDGEERALEAADLLICSGDEPVALAGIMGGEATKVSGDTERLLLEVAAFHAATIRRTASRIGLRTDSSARFEKSLDPTLPMKAAGHLVRLLQELQPGVSVSAPIADAGDWSDPALTIPLRCGRVRQLLGIDVSDADVKDILERLGFGVTGEGAELSVRVPSERATKDVTIEQDLVEEVGRIWRYANVPERALVAELRPPARDERRLLVRRLEDRLAGGARFHQSIRYSFVSDGMVEKLGEAELDHVTVVNPVAEGLARIRRSVVPSLLEVLEGNRRGREEVRLFEIGKAYVPAGAKEPEERHELALVVSRTPPGKKARFDEGALPSLRGIVEDLAAATERGPFELGRSEGEVPAWAHPGKALAVSAGGAPVGLLATLEPGLARRIGLAGELASDTAVACLSLDALLALPERARKYVPVPRFPSVKIDVALLVAEAVPAGDVRAVIEKAGKGRVSGAELFDVYAGESVGAGKKSLAWHVRLGAGDRTLDEKDVKKYLDRLERMAADVGGELRRE